MLGRPYTVVADAVAETTAQSLIRLSAPSDAIVVVTRAWIGIDNVDDLNEPLAAQLHRASTDGTGSSITARPMQVGDAAFGGTAVGTITADPTAGNILVRQGFNAAAGWEWTPYDESECIVISPSGRLVLHLDVAPSVSMDFTSGLTFYEIGG